MTDIEHRLSRLAGDFPFPPTPDLAGETGRRLAPTRTPLGSTRRLAFVAAVVALALGGTLAFSSSARGALADLFDFVPGVRIERVEELPAMPFSDWAAYGEEVPLDRARSLAGFELALPGSLGEPDFAYHYRDESGADVVTVVWGERTEARAVLSTWPADTVLVHKILGPGTEAEVVDVAGGKGVWISRLDHVVFYEGRDGVERAVEGALAGNTLVWQDGELARRLEAGVPLERALALAAELRNDRRGAGVGRAMRLVGIAVVLCAAALAAGCSGEASEAEEQAPTPAAPGLELPYDLEVDGEGRVYVADGLLRRVLRHDPVTGETVVVAGTGAEGSTGDGGPATEATFEEPVGIAFDPDGNLYVVDFPAGTIRRIAPDGTVSTLADGIETPAAAAVDPTGGHLAVPTLGSYLYRIDLASGEQETLAGDGTPVDAGDGGPAREATVETPHGAAYDAEGNLYVPGIDGSVRRIDAATGVIETVEATAGGAAAETFKIVVAPGGTLYLVAGSPAGGVIRRLDPDGTLEVVVGTGTLGASEDGMPATEIGILPSDVAVAPDGALIFSQSQPEPAVRRVDPETGLVETLFR